MELHIGKNIKHLRKERSMTQEQLSEALGVTVGAVYKWENSLSMPEINMLVELADFFEVSVDYLLGYTMEKGGPDAALKRIENYLSVRKLEDAMREGEKALQKYPNNFDVVCSAAQAYFLMARDSEKAALRCIELVERACMLFDQNTDESITLNYLHSCIATCYIGLKQYDKCIEMLKKLNADGSQNDMIGLVLAEFCNKPEEALMYLSAGIYGNIVPLIRSVIGFSKAYTLLGELDKAQEIVNWGLNILMGLRDSAVNSYMDKLEVVLITILGDVHCRMGDSAAAYTHLRNARNKACKFDDAPDYRTAAGLKFYYLDQESLSLDDLGDTAMLAIEAYIERDACEDIKAIWKEIKNEKD